MKNRLLGEFQIGHGKGIWLGQLVSSIRGNSGNSLSVFLSVWRSSLQIRLYLLVCVSNAAHGVLMVNLR